MVYAIIAFTCGFIGKFLLGVTVLLVHQKIEKERGIDQPVLMEMKREQVVGILGLLFIIAEYSFHMLSALA